MNALFADITSGDAQKIWASSSAIVALRDAAALDALAAHVLEIRAKTDGIPLGGALMPNSERLKFALRKLDYWREKAGCLCRLYPERLMYDPKREAEAGNVRLLSTTSDAAAWPTTYTCACTLCGANYSVEEGEYHYTWWKWTPLT